MMKGRKWLRGVLALLLAVCLGAGTGYSANPTVVRNSVNNGVRYLFTSAVALGPAGTINAPGEVAWEAGIFGENVGATGLAVLAIIMSMDPGLLGANNSFGIKNNQTIHDALNYMLVRQDGAGAIYGDPNHAVYETSCAMWAFIAALMTEDYYGNANCLSTGNSPVDKVALELAIDRAAGYLASVQRLGPLSHPSRVGGWGYSADWESTDWTDMSNTQFAVWALKAYNDYKPASVGNLAAAAQYVTFHQVNGSKPITSAYQCWEGLPNYGFGYLPACHSLWAAHGNRNGYGSMTYAGLGIFAAAGTWNGVHLGATVDCFNGFVNGTGQFAYNIANLGTNPGLPPFSTTENRFYYYHAWTATKTLAMYNFFGPTMLTSGIGAPGGGGYTSIWLANFPGVGTIPEYYNQAGGGNDITDRLIAMQDVPAPFPHWNGADWREGQNIATCFALLAEEVYLPPVFPVVLPPFLEIILNSPGQAYVMDGAGNKTGIVNGELVEEVADASCTPAGEYPQKIRLDRFMGAISLVVAGTEDGPYTLSVDTYFKGELNLARHKQISRGISKGQEHRYGLGVHNILYPYEVLVSWSERKLELTAASRKRAVELDWLCALDADSYELLRSEDGEDFDSIAELAGNVLSYEDAVDKALYDQTLYYRVVARDELGGELYVSDTAVARPYQTAGHLKELSAEGAAPRGGTVQVQALVLDSKKRLLPGVQVSFSSNSQGAAFVGEQQVVAFTGVDGYARATLYVARDLMEAQVEVEAMAVDLQQGSKGPRKLLVAVE